MGFEEERVRHNIRQQEQLDEKGYDERDHEKDGDKADNDGTF